MARRIFVSLALSISCVLLLAACGGADNTTNGASNTGNANKPANTTTTTSPTNTGTSTTTTTTTTTTSGEKIGVPECDDYLAKLEACIMGKVPAAARTQYEASMEQTRKSWREMAANPQTKAGLAQACKMAVDASKQTYKTFGCEF